MVRGQALGQRPDDRDAAGDGRLEPDGPLGLAGGVEHLRPMGGEQRLVRGDDVLAGGEGVQHHGPGERRPAGEFDDDVDGRVGEGVADDGRNEFRRHRRAGLRRVADDDAAQRELPAGPAGEAVGVFEQQSGHAGADGAAADQRDAERFRHVPKPL